MVGKPRKWPQLYDVSFWHKNAKRTDVEIGRELGIPASTVRAARRRMRIKPISVSEASRRTWRRKEFRASRSAFPQLYDRSFWQSRQGYTSSEIAEEMGCTPSSVKKAREALGFRSPSRSEAQKRRFERDLPKTQPRPRRRRAPMTPGIRAKSLDRASGRCEIPICQSRYNLEVEHIIDVRYFPQPDDADYLENTVVLCLPHHDWWSSLKTDYMNRLRKALSPRQAALDLFREYFPNAHRRH